MNTSFETTDKTKTKDEWLTPPYIIEALGKFDLDPCSPKVRPFETADNYYTEDDNGLMQNWEGRVWLNPPYGDHSKYWLEKASHHKNVIALIFARTETSYFFEYIWNRAVALFFIKGRVSFYHVDGTKGDSAGAPSVLVAYDEFNADVLRNCNLKGKYVRIYPT